MIHVLPSYDFWAVVSSVALFAAVTAVIDCSSVYRGQSLTGDALGHASYSGVVSFFMLFWTRNPLTLCLGVVVSAAVSYALILWLQSEKKLAPGAVLATVFAGMLGLGMILKTFIQGNPAFRNTSQSGLRVYIFGSTAFMTKRDVWFLLLGVLLPAGLLYSFRRSLQYSSFDPGYAVSLGIPERLIDTVMLCLTVVVTALGIWTVGVTLILAFLLLLCVAASQRVKTFSTVLRFAVAMAVCSASLGCAVSTNMAGISIDPMIIVRVGVFTSAAFLFRLGKERG